MKTIIYILAALLASINAKATPGISEQVLDSKLATELGFTVSISSEGETTSVTLGGPVVVKNGCYPGGSGTYLTDPNDDELMVHIAVLNKDIGEHKAFGYVVGTSNNMGVFIDYFCPKGRELESTRYSVPSIRQWLIDR